MVRLRGIVQALLSDLLITTCQADSGATNRTVARHFVDERPSTLSNL